MNLSLLIPLFAFLTVGPVATRAALPPHLYWHSLLLTGSISGGVSIQPPLRDGVGLTPIYHRYHVSDDRSASMFFLEQNLNAMFYCHKLEKTTAYTVPLEGADGIRVKAVAVCHADKSQWHPKHMALRVLKVKPGTVPVCHFLPHHDNLVWVPMHLQIL